MTKKEIVDAIYDEYYRNGNYMEAFEKAADKILAEEAKEKPTQRQDSTRDQLRDVAAMADKMGCYDAADVIRNGWPKEKPIILWTGEVSIRR